MRSRLLPVLCLLLAGTAVHTEVQAQIPQDPVLAASRLLVRGMTRSFLGDHAGALAYFDQALRLQPEDAAIHAAIAELHLDQGDLTQASFFAERAVSLSPEEPELLRLVAQVRRSTGDLIGSLEALTRLTRIRPRELQAHVERGRLLAELGQRSEALASYRRADDLAPLPPGVLQELLDLQVDSGDLAGALDTSGRLLEASPEAGPLVTRARILVQMGRESEAVPLFLRALAADAANAEAREALAALAPQLLPEVQTQDLGAAELARRAEENLRDLDLRIRALEANLAERDLTTARRLHEDGMLFFPGQEALALLGAELALLRLDLDEASTLLSQASGPGARTVEQYLEALSSGTSLPGALPASGSLRVDESLDLSPLEWLALGDARKREGRNADAVRAWRRALESAPNSALLLSRLQ